MLHAFLVLLIITRISAIRSPNNKIYNGTYGGEKFPFIVAVLSSTHHVLCTGSLLRSNRILTTASCVFRGTATYCLSGETHVYGDYTYTWRHEAQKRLVAQFFMHPQAKLFLDEHQDVTYQSTISENYDIAIIEVDPPFILGEYVKTISIAQFPIQSSAWGTIPGYGSDALFPVREGSDGILRYGYFQVRGQLCHRGDYPSAYCVQSDAYLTLTGDCGGPLLSFKKPFELYGITAKYNFTRKYSIIVNAITNRHWIDERLGISLKQNGKTSQNFNTYHAVRLILLLIILRKIVRKIANVIL